MRLALRALAFPVACAFTGASVALLVQVLRAPAPDCPPAPAPATVVVPATVLAPVPPPPPAPPLAFAPPLLAPPEPAPLQIPDSAVRCPEPTRCVISRVFLDTILANPSQLARQARVMPSIRDGQALGFKFYGIRPGSLPNLIGFKNGDLLRAVNGEPLLSVDNAMAAFSRLRRATSFDLELVRKGEPLHLRLDLE